MKKHFYLLLILCLLILIFSYKADVPVSYSQSILHSPEKIEIVYGAEILTLEKGSSQFKKLVDIFRMNWWKYDKDKNETTNTASLTEVTTLSNLRTTTNRTYLSQQDIIVRFLYTTPIQWDISPNSSIDIKLIAFFIPSKSINQTNTKGYFTVSKTVDIGVNEGLYIYYFAPEVVNDFWSFLNE